MRKKLMGTYIIIIAFTMLFTILFSWNRVKDSFIDRLEEENHGKLVLVREILEKEQAEGGLVLQDFVGKYADKIATRITIINQQGVVIADSESNPETMGNHKNRTEIAAAIATGDFASSLRFSTTVKMYYQYTAVPIDIDGIDGVLRIATPLDEINGIIKDFLLLLILGIIVGALLSIALAYYLSSRLMAPIVELKDAAVRTTQGNYADKIYLDQKDEIGQLAEAFNTMTYNLKTNLDDLEEKNAELESILDSLTNGLMVIDMDFKVRIYNEQFVEHFRIEDIGIKGKLFYEIIRNLVVFELVEQVMETGERRFKETKFYFENLEKTYLIFANPICSKENKSLQMGVLLIVQDISQMRKLENMRSDFVSNVTHELKTPLTSIRGFIDTLKGGALTDPEVANRFLDIIDIESERLEGLINDILILSEIEAMGADKNVVLNPVEDILAEVDALLRPEAEGKGLVLTIEISQGLAPYACNRNRIKQLLINLLSNAIKYTDQGSVVVRCREEFRYMILEVEDTGIGVEAVHIPRLFERFYRVDKGRSRATGGTGLGLSIVKHIVELYNGKIKVESHVGQGTRITVRLPY